MWHIERKLKSVVIGTLDPNHTIRGLGELRMQDEPTLHFLIKHAKKAELVKNNLFPSREKWATQIAKERFGAGIHAKMISEGLNEIVYDDSHVTPTEVDLNHDWLSNFIDVIPRLRNDLAHGSSTLRHSVVHTFDVVSSIINQLYPGISKQKKHLYKEKLSITS